MHYQILLIAAALILNLAIISAIVSHYRHKRILKAIEHEKVEKIQFKEGVTTKLKWLYARVESSTLNEIHYLRAEINSLPTDYPDDLDISNAVADLHNQLNKKLNPQYV